MELRQATRTKAKLRIGIAGPSGSGKTYSALLLASGMTTWDKIAIIDTENGSADLYEHIPQQFADIKGGHENYNVLTLEAPFSPERYINAIQSCEKAGMEVIIIDSVSHEWEGKGGCLEFNEQVAQTRFKGNTWAAWSMTTPKHQKFLEAILTSSAHVITTARSKIETVQTESKKVKKIGIKEIQREGFEYELTLNFELDRETHFASVSKDRTELFKDDLEFKITQDTGKTLKEWAEKGKEAPVVSKDELVDTKPGFTHNKSAELVTVFSQVAEKEKWTQEQIKNNWDSILANRELSEIEENKIEAYIKLLRKKL